jgi:ABC-type transporter MlaC component
MVRTFKDADPVMNGANQKLGARLLWLGWTAWRGVLGGALALLLIAPTATAQAQTVSPAPVADATKPVKTTAKKPEPTHPAKKAAANETKAKPSVKKVAAAPKKPEPKKIAAVAKKPAEVKRVADAAPQNSPPSYTITTTRNHVTYTTTRIVPLTPTPTPASAPAALPVAAAAPTPAEMPAPAPVVVATAKPAPQIAALPVSLTRRAEPPTIDPEEPAAPPASGASSASSAPAATFVANFLDQAFKIARAEGTTSLTRRAKLADLFGSKMDVKRIAGYTTANELTEMSPEMQQRFRTILISYLVETYYPRLELASDPAVIVETTPAAPLPDGTAVVWTTFSKQGWGSQSVKWQLMAEGGGFKIVDIFSAGASLVQMERDTFLSVMRDGGVPELMAKLDARTKQLATAATE